MTNIYNKFFHVPNGTLVGNWYEEQCLRDKTNEGRSILFTHVPKNANKDEVKRNDTFQRTIGDKTYNEFSTTYSTYGDFDKYQNFEKRLPLKDKIYNNFFDCYTSKNDDIIKNMENK